jgi:PAS domain S-box-containing protein
MTDKTTDVESLAAENDALRRRLAEFEADAIKRTVQVEKQQRSNYAAASYKENKEVRGERGSHAEEALRESEKKYRNLFETTNDSVFVVDGETLEILDVNAAACRLYGYSREEFLRMRTVDISAEPAKSADAVRDRITAVSLRFHRKKDGTVFPVEITGGYFTQGNRSYHTAIIRDITERKRAEEALSNSEKRYRALVERSFDSVTLLSADAEESIPESAIHYGEGTILVADDEPRLLKSLTQILETLGYEVLTAAGGREAVEVVRVHKDKLSLVLLDLTMPGMSGAKTFNAMREIAPTLKVLLSSGYSIEGQAQELLARGCCGFIQKPFDVKRLSAKLKEVL